MKNNLDIYDHVTNELVEKDRIIYKLIIIVNYKKYFF